MITQQQQYDFQHDPGRITPQETPQKVLSQKDDEKCKHIHTIITNGYKTCTECGYSIEWMDFSYPVPYPGEHNLVSNEPMYPREVQPGIGLKSKAAMYTMTYNEVRCEKVMVMVSSILFHIDIVSSVIKNEVGRYVKKIIDRRLACGRNMMVYVAMIISLVLKKNHIYREDSEILTQSLYRSIDGNNGDAKMSEEGSNNNIIFKQQNRLFQITNILVHEFPELRVLRTLSERVYEEIIKLLNRYNLQDHLNQISQMFEKLKPHITYISYPKAFAVALLRYMFESTYGHAFFNNISKDVKITRLTINKYQNIITKTLLMIGDTK